MELLAVSRQVFFSPSMHCYNKIKSHVKDTPLIPRYVYVHLNTYLSPFHSIWSYLGTTHSTSSPYYSIRLHQYWHSQPNGHHIGNLYVKWTDIIIKCYLFLELSIGHYSNYFHDKILLQSLSSSNYLKGMGHFQGKHLCHLQFYLTFHSGQ